MKFLNVVEPSMCNATNDIRSKDGSTIDMRRYTPCYVYQLASIRQRLSLGHTRHIRRRTRNKKRPPPTLPTLLCQRLQIKHLPNWTPPHRQQILMQHIVLVSRPALKRRRITRHSGKVAIMQPIDHGLLLFHASPFLLAVRADAHRPFGELLELLIWFGVVVLDEATAYEKHIPNLYISALCLRANINALIFAASFELGVGDSIVGEGIEGYTIFLRIGLPVEQDAAPGYAVLAPVMLGAFQVRVRADKVRALGVVVEEVGGDVADMAESIPLGAALGIEGVGVIVGHVLVENLDVVLEGFAPKTGRGRLVQR